MRPSERINFRELFSGLGAMGLCYARYLTRWRMRSGRRNQSPFLLPAIKQRHQTQESDQHHRPTGEARE